MLPANDAIALKPRRDDVVIRGTVDVVADVFFATPHDLHGSIHLLRDPCRVVRHVGLQAPPEAASKHVVVDGHLRLRQVCGLRDSGVHALHHLCTDPRFRRGWRDMHRAVHRLHGRMREQRHLVFLRHDSFRERRIDVADILGDRAIALARAPQT